MASPVPLDNLLTRLIGESHDVALLWQLGVLLTCALAAWGLLRLTRYWLEKPVSGWSAGRGGVRRVTLPLLFLLAVLVAREIADLWLADTHLLNLAVPLLLSLVLVRLIVYSLRYVFQGNDSIRVWERTAAWLIWGAFAFHITGLLPHIHAALEGLSFEAAGHRFSVWLLLQALAVIVAAVIVSLALARLVESRLLRLEQMNLSLRMALAKAARTVLLILAVLVALPAVGIDLTVLSVFGGALGVGIGFGLQKVASNYVSGFIILLDRSVRIGDLITVYNI
jgi:small-conductance mechanosensitive channel